MIETSDPSQRSCIMGNISLKTMTRTGRMHGLKISSLTVVLFLFLYSLRVALDDSEFIIILICFTPGFHAAPQFILCVKTTRLAPPS